MTKSKPTSFPPKPEIYDDAAHVRFLQAMDSWKRFHFWSGDEVEITSFQWNGRKGKIAGFYSANTYLVLLDEPVKDIFGFTHTCTPQVTSNLKLIKRGADYEEETRRRSGDHIRRAGNREDG